MAITSASARIWRLDFYLCQIILTDPREFDCCTISYSAPQWGAFNAGIAATVCSVLIVALALLAMHTLPVGFCRFCSSKRRDKFRATRVALRRRFAINY